MPWVFGGLICVFDLQPHAAVVKGQLSELMHVVIATQRHVIRWSGSGRRR